MEPANGELKGNININYPSQVNLSAIADLISRRAIVSKFQTWSEIPASIAVVNPKI
jgi:hypothetical protein